MPDTKLRATTRQLRTLMIAALASGGLALILSCVGLFNVNAIAVAAPIALVALVFVPAWLVYLSAFVRLDERGVTTRLIRTHSCDWKDVESIRVRQVTNRRTGAKSYSVRVKPRRGTDFTLAVPVSGGIMPDPDFDTRVRLVETAWRLHGGREIAAVR